MGAIAKLDVLSVGSSIELATADGQRTIATGVPDSSGGYTPPAGAEGDLLVFHAGAWSSVIAPGPAGTVLTSNGLATVPGYAAPALLTTGALTMPALNATTVLGFNSTSSLRAGVWIFLNGAGWLQVEAPITSTTATLRNIAGVAGNVAPTTVVASGALAVVSGPELDPTRYDVRRFGATPSDLGPGVQGALNAAKTSFGGTVYVPGLEGGAVWTWVTPVLADFSGINPGTVEVVGDAANVHVLLSDPTQTLLLIENVPSGTVRFAGFNFVGDATVSGQDCANLVQIGFVSNVLVENCNCYGLEGNTSLWNLNGFIVAVRNLAMFEVSQTLADGGLIYVSGSALDVGNVRVFDIGSFDASGAAKNRAQADVFVLSADCVYIHDCQFDEDVIRNIHVTCGFAGFFTGTATVARTRFNTPNPANGFDCAIRTDGPGRIRILEVQDCFFAGARQGNILNLAAVDNVRLTGNFNLAGSTGNGTANPLDGAHLIETRTGVGNLTIIDCDPQLALAPQTGAPSSVVLTQNGTTVAYPLGLQGVLAWYDAGQLMQINPTFNVGVAGTFAPVTATHHLDFTFNTNYHFVVPFAGTENSAATFAAAIQTALNSLGPTGALATVTGGGQVQITMPTTSAGNFYFVTESQATIDGTSSADVLASLGMTAGAFTNPSTVLAWGDSTGTDPTHNLTNITGTPVYTFQSANFGNRPSVTTSTTDLLASSTWTTPVAQPVTVVIIGRVTGANGVFFSGLAADGDFFLQGITGGGQFHFLCPSNIGFPWTAGNSVLICRVNGAASDFAQNTTTLQAPQNPGGNGFTGVTLGNEGGGGAGGVEIASVVVIDHMIDLSERRLLVEWAAQRYGIVEV